MSNRFSGFLHHLTNVHLKAQCLSNRFFRFLTSRTTWRFWPNRRPTTQRRLRCFSLPRPLRCDASFKMYKLNLLNIKNINSKNVIWTKVIILKAHTFISIVGSEIRGKLAVLKFGIDTVCFIMQAQNPFVVLKFS